MAQLNPVRLGATLALAILLVLGALLGPWPRGWANPPCTTTDVAVDEPCQNRDETKCESVLVFNPGNGNWEIGCKENTRVTQVFVDLFGCEMAKNPTRFTKCLDLWVPVPTIPPSLYPVHMPCYEYRRCAPNNVGGVIDCRPFGPAVPVTQQVKYTYNCPLVAVGAE